MGARRLVRYVATTGVFISGCLTGHDIITTNLTYSRDISRIFSAHCVSCHGVRSSIPLAHYGQVRPWAVDIKEQVLSRSMPPWGAVKGFGDLAPDLGLSEEDIMIISAWVIGGAPEEDQRMLPKESTIPEARPGKQLADALTVETATMLRAPLKISGIRPLVDSVVPSARVTATLPDGQVEPLIWLYQYDPKAVDPQMQGAFGFRRSLELPPGTVVQSSVPLRFALETNAAKELLPGS